MNNNNTAGQLISSALAFFISYSAGNSVGWVVFHTLCGMFYVAYYALTVGGWL